MVKTKEQKKEYDRIYHANRRDIFKFFDNIVKMPINNPGYDYICGKGFML